MFSRMCTELIARREESPYKNWIKLIPLDKLVPFSTYKRTDDFTKVADVVLDESEKRQTHLAFNAVVEANVFKDPHEWIYLIVIDGHVVKIGGTRKGMQSRMLSYNCGRHVAERGGSGKCSVTNAFVYNTLVFYAELGFTIELYGRLLPSYNVAVPIFGATMNIKAQVFHGIESTYIKDFKETYGFGPFLSDNSDPTYRAGLACKALTKKGTQCTSRAHKDHGDYCKTHSVMNARSASVMPKEA